MSPCGRKLFGFWAANWQLGRRPANVYAMRPAEPPKQRLAYPWPGQRDTFYEATACDEVKGNCRRTQDDVAVCGTKLLIIESTEL